MKTGLLVFISLVALALAWAALDDITTGSEPSFGLEWTMVGAAILWLAFVVAIWRRHRNLGR